MQKWHISVSHWMRSAPASRDICCRLYAPEAGESSVAWTAPPPPARSPPEI